MGKGNRKWARSRYGETLPIPVLFRNARGMDRGRNGAYLVILLSCIIILVPLIRIVACDPVVRRQRVSHIQRRGEVGGKGVLDGEGSDPGP